MRLHEYSIKIAKRGDFIWLVPLGDIHIGVRNCSENEFLKVVDWIKQTPNAYWLGMGDHIEAINYSDKRFDPSNIHERFHGHLDDLVKYQAAHFVKLVEPIKGKCIGLLEGNHEDTIRNYYHVNIVDVMAHQLGTVNLTYTTMVRLNFKRENHRRNVVVWASHGFGAGRYVGGKLNNLLQVAKDFLADIYLVGHTHELASMSRDHLAMTTSDTPRLQAHKRVYGITGSFLKTYEVDSRSYGEKKGYAPVRTGVLKIKIVPMGRYNSDGTDAPPDITISED